MRIMRSVMWGLMLLGCGRAESPSLVHCAPADAKTRALALQHTIAKGEIDRCAVAEDAAADVEIRDALVETDERSRESHTGHAALSARLLSLAGRTIEATGPLRCFGACCDVEHHGMTAGRLYLRRMCFAYASRLSLITFVEVR